MLFNDFINKLIKIANNLLDQKGWSLAFEILEENNKIFLEIKHKFKELANLKHEIHTFQEIYKNKESITQNVKNAKENDLIESFTVFTYHQQLVTEITNLFNNSEYINIFKKVQENNYSYVNSFSVKNFFSVEEVEFNEIEGAKEIYFLGENGDGKTLILMALHLAFNANEIRSKTNEYTGKIIEILDSNPSSEFIAKDISGSIYGNKQGNYLKNIFAYGAHRGRYSSDNFEPYGFMSLYDIDTQLYSPEKLLSQIFLLELEKKLDNQNSISENKSLPNWVSIETIKNLFSELLEQNVKILVSSQGVKFIEKGFELSFNQLSEGYKNIMIWVSDMIYRFQQNQPYTNKLEDFIGVVLLDEIELHLHLIWQRRLMSQLRHFFPKVQFIVTTHSPSIIQGASKEAVIYRIYRNHETGKTCTSEAYFKKDLSHLMLNTLATSPLFGLENARIDEKSKELDTSDTYLQSKIRHKVDLELKKQKAEGKEFLSELEIDQIIDKILKEESVND